MFSQYIYESWSGNPVKLTWIADNQMPNKHLVTSVHAFCFEGDKLLLVRIEGRGFNVPGGHLEQDEEPLEALNRELLEEAYVTACDPRLLGHIIVDHSENERFDPNGKYPLIGYQLFYRMELAQLNRFERKHESTCRIWVEGEEAPHILDDHDLVKKHILPAALSYSLKP